MNTRAAPFPPLPQFPRLVILKMKMGFTNARLSPTLLLPFPARGADVAVALTAVVALQASTVCVCATGQFAA